MIIVFITTGIMMSFLCDVLWVFILKRLLGKVFFALETARVYMTVILACICLLGMLSVMPAAIGFAVVLLSGHLGLLSVGLVASVRLAREDISRLSLQVSSVVVADSVSLARSILDRVLRKPSARYRSCNAQRPPSLGAFSLDLRKVCRIAIRQRRNSPAYWPVTEIS